MTQTQYNFYKAEAELPGITAQFSKLLVGGLLRKQPTLTLPDDVPADAMDWIMNQFAKDGAPLSAFLDQALFEEIQTSRAWVLIDHPNIPNAEDMTKEELSRFKPYPVLFQAESIINWRVQQDKYGKSVLDRVIIRGLTDSYTENEFHPTMRETVWVHELDESGYYQVRVFKRDDNSSSVPVIAGQIQKDPSASKPKFILEETISNIQANNNRFYCSGHGSLFSTTGAVLNGPAAAPLKQYKTTRTGNNLRIFE